MNQVRKISKSYTVELAILNNTNSRVQFGDNETILDNKVITGVAVLPQWIGYAPSGRQIVPFLAQMRTFLTLSNPKKEKTWQDMPVELFFREDPIIHVKPMMVSLRNSYVDIPEITSYVIAAGPPPGLAMVFTFFYEDYDPSKYRKNSLGEIDEIDQ